MILPFVTERFECVELFLFFVFFLSPPDQIGTRHLSLSSCARSWRGAKGKGGGAGGGVKHSRTRPGVNAEYNTSMPSVSCLVSQSHHKKSASVLRELQVQVPVVKYEVLSVEKTEKKKKKRARGLRFGATHPPFNTHPSRVPSERVRVTPAWKKD